MPMTSFGTPGSPTDPRDRMLAVDALRGLALVGIAIVNVPWIGFRVSLPSLLASETARAALSSSDLGAALFVEGLCEGRFYPIFSALFGFGTGVLLDRGLPIYARRVAALIVLGLLHASFGWYGDVLLNYAAAGLVLIAFARLSPRALFGIAIATLVATQLASLRFDGWLWSASGEDTSYLDAAVHTYRDGTFGSITLARLDELRGYFTAPWNISYRINVLAMATLGLALERANVHARLRELRRPIGRLAIAATAIGLVLAVSLALVPQLYIVAGDVLAMGYALSFVWIATGARRAWLVPFARVGRMALTCYLLQTVCFTLFFYGYGLAMYGRLGPLQGVGLAVGVYAAEAVLATLWLARFEYGPMEWLWRAATYLSWPAIRRRVRADEVASKRAA